MTDDNGGNFFVPIAAKNLASRTVDDDDDDFGPIWAVSVYWSQIMISSGFYNLRSASSSDN